MNFELGHFDLNESWNRSRNFGISPFNAEVERISTSELKDRKICLNPLFQSSTHVLENLYSQLKQMPFMVIVTDAEGYIISTWGDSPFLNQAKAVSLECGVNWEEKRKGTNAIGTSIIEKRPIQVIGDEHYVEENKFLTCYAAPLYSPTGEMIGVLDVSGDVRFHHPHTLGMVIATAHACQSNILLNSLHRELVLTLKETDHIVKGTSKPLISLDEEGLIKRINHQAAQLLNAEIKSCIGQPLSNWVEKELVHTLLHHKGNESFEFDLKTHTKLPGNWAIEKIFDDRRQTYRIVMTTSLANNDKPQTPKVHPVSTCPKFHKTLQLAMKVAPTNATILICGETGTGKEVMAKEIHEASDRRGPLVVVNCGAIPDNLLESELFGYAKGAFTGANDQGHKGKFLAADRGTLFLDEIGEMSLASQVVLLRVLEERKVTPIGSNKAIPFDVRIIAATNRDLRKEIAEKRFRADLYYRLCELELLLPPLREREDLLELANFFIDTMERELKLSCKIVLDESAKRLLQNYNWPGNIRELKHMIRQAIYHMYYARQSNILTKDDFSIPYDDTKIETSNDDPLSIEQNEQKMIAEALKMTKGNLSKAASLLKMGRTTLYRKLNQYPNLKKLRSNAKIE